MRRDLYLKAIEGSAELRQAVLSLLDPETDHRVVTGAETAAAGALSAVYLVATPQTARAVASYFLELQRVKAVLLMQRTEAVEAKAMQVHSTAQQQIALARRGELFRQQTDLIARGVGEHEDEWRVLSSKIAAESGHLDFYGREATEWLNRYRIALKPLLLSLIERVDPLEAAGLAALLCIRNELGIETDVSDFEATYAKLSEENRRFAMNILQQVEAVTEPPPEVKA
ncbi:hypothetical protein GCM10007242_41380 [Pigmentiphaga litoralis]|nr:hypothetical protein GCM10007242_41380 [Pigmentiphaga litoralis]